jgi:peptidoglycan/LPS O-acetylase OafA/YrhL
MAALSVFLSHAVGLLYETNTIKALQASPLRIFWDGAAAVDLFFVLSGLVLALPYVSSGNNPRYLQFCIRRIFRIYPAFWIALCISLALRAGYATGEMSGLSDWALSLWTYPVTRENLLRHLPLVISTNTRVIDPVIWSLGIEMRMSLVLPGVIVALNYSHRRSADFAIAAAALILGAAIDSLMFLPLFVVGALAAKHLTAMIGKFTEMRRASSVGLLSLGILLYGNRWIFSSSTPLQEHLASAVGTLVFILVIISTPTLAKLLSAPISRFIGHTSYSFYLLHLPILLFTTSHLYHLTNSSLLCSLVAIALAYLFAFLVFRFLEQPANIMGKKLAKIEFLERVSNNRKHLPAQDAKAARSEFRKGEAQRGLRP